jgi:hypothetical protein
MPKLHLIIVSDLGCLNAYRVLYDELTGKPRLEIIESLTLIEARKRLRELLSDEGGRFPVISVHLTAAGATGERHNLELERRKRLLSVLAEAIEEIVEEEKPKRWALSSPPEVAHRLLEKLSQRSKSTLVKVVEADLTKVNKSDLLSYFQDS